MFLFGLLSLLQCHCVRLPTVASSPIISFMFRLTKILTCPLHTLSIIVNIPTTRDTDVWEPEIQIVSILRQFINISHIRSIILSAFVNNSIPDCVQRDNFYISLIYSILYSNSNFYIATMLSNALPKIYKKDCPFRIIVSSIGSPLHALASFLLTVYMRICLIVI